MVIALGAVVRGGSSSVLFAAVLGVAIAAAVVILIVAFARDSDSTLRRCPLCDEDAVAANELVIIDMVQVQVGLRCGQCGAWRRLITTYWAARGLERRLDAERRAMAGWAARLEHERAASDIDAFGLALRRDVVGAVDFLALTRRGGPSGDPPRRGSMT